MPTRFDQFREKASELFEDRFVFDEHNTGIIQTICKWHETVSGELEVKDFFGRPIDSQKGIGLIGKTGVGKNWIFEVLYELTRGYARDFIRDDAHKLSSSFSEKGMPWFNMMKITHMDWNIEGKRCRGYSRLINDLGDEDPGRHMGHQFDVVKGLVMHYDDLVGPDITRLFHFTSNSIPGKKNVEGKEMMVLPSISSRYGERAHWRIVNMCNILYLGGPNRRAHG